jgi:hypothetical protein
MKTIRILLLLLFILFLFHSDFRKKSQRDLYSSFLNKEQSSFKVLEDYDVNEKMFTGVQYAALQEYYKTLDPSELRVPMERLGIAFEQTSRKKAASTLKASNEFKMEWLPLDSDLGGRVRALMWDPNDPDYKRVWTAGVTGGLWKREDIFDDTKRWMPVDDFWPGLAVSCLAYDPVNTTTFYAGTGEGQTARIIYRESSGRGFGIMKSDDGGENWSLIESSKDFAYVTDIAVRDEGGNGVIYAGVVSGEYQGQFISSSPDDGLYRSDDGGSSWTQVLPDVPGTDHSYAPSDIEITANGRIFVGTGLSLDKTGAGNVLYSDDGLNWEIFGDYADTIANADFYNFAGRVMLASAPSDGNTVYAVLTAAGGYFLFFQKSTGSPYDQNYRRWAKLDES